jgi:hypothetical protein
MCKLLDAEEKNNRNAFHIAVHHIVHRMGPEASNLAKKGDLCQPGPCRQADSTDHNVTGPRNGDWLQIYQQDYYISAKSMSYYNGTTSKLLPV